MRRVLGRLVVALGVVGIVVAMLMSLYAAGYVRLNYPSAEEYPVRGIDVSHHQGRIDWLRLTREADIDFAFIKASEGADLQDRRFAQNWRGAEGLVDRGPYHFFTFCTAGDRQAENFLATVPDQSELPPAIDVEFAGNCSSWTSIASIRRELRVFLDRIDGAARTPILYVTVESYGRLIRGHFDSPIWLREVVFHPSADDYGNLLFWQFAGNGRLPGVETLVDLNAFVGSRSAYGDLVRRNESAS